MILYHGTDSKFNKFSKSKIGSNTNVTSAGFFLTDNYNTAKSYGDVVLKCDVDLGAYIEFDFNGTTHTFFIDKEYTPSELSLKVNELNETLEFNCNLSSYFDIETDPEIDEETGEILSDNYWSEEDIQDYLDSLGEFNHMYDDKIDTVICKNIKDNMDFGGELSNNYIIFDENRIKVLGVVNEILNEEDYKYIDNKNRLDVDFSKEGLEKVEQLRNMKISDVNEGLQKVTVYHGSSNKNLRFNHNKPLMFFTVDKDDAHNWADRLILGNKRNNTGSYIYTAELTYNKPYMPGDSFNSEYEKYKDSEDKEEIFGEIFFEDINDRRKELVNAGYDCFIYPLLGYYVIPYECRRNIKWINKEEMKENLKIDLKDAKKLNEELEYILNERLEKLSDCFITKSAYDIVNLLKNKPKEYRILYDKNINMYMIGDANDITHWDMIQKAYKDAYYYNMEDFIEELGGELDNYVDIGQSGFWDGDTEEENIEPYLWYIVFSPNEEWTLGTDGYNKRYDYPLGHVFTRSCDLDEIDLWDALGVPENIESL